MGVRRPMSLTAEREWRERMMAKRNIRIRHRRSRSPSPPGIRTRSPPGPPRKPANILETPQEVLENRKDAAVDAPIKEAAAAVKAVVTGPSKTTDVDVAKQRCTKCGQRLKGEI